jgi:hypothetical protein
MDWSLPLFQTDTKKRFLRDIRGYKNPNWYYLAMVLDPILRFNWIFYSLYTQDLQHSTLVSFLVGFSEVSRRGMWTLFRVENEHCANVARFKASRDVPLPYDIEASPSGSEEALSNRQETPISEIVSTSPVLSRYRSQTTGANTTSPESSNMRHRAPTRTFTKIMAEAHTQDFEKKRKPGAGDSDNVENMRRDGSPVGNERESSSDEEDDEEDDEVMLEAEGLIRDRNGS